MPRTAGEPRGSGHGAAVSAFARAKVNLTLHVVGRRADGYHDLESLVVFPEIGDALVAEPATGLGLAIDGPFAGELDAGGGNLALRAATALQSVAQARGAAAPGAALRLTKRLPIASGIGGGSSDAAATLAALWRLWDLERVVTAHDLASLALEIGADVPACLAQPRPLLMEGLGERLSDAPPLPACWMVLVNPGEPLETAEVFRRRPEPRGAGPALPAEGFPSLDALASWLAGARNDLSPIAESLRPGIGRVLDALRRAEGCRFARMSGSGATCFGLFETEEAALDAEEALARAESRWWIAAGPLMSEQR